MKMKPATLYISKRNRRIKLVCAQRGAVYLWIFLFKQQHLGVESRVSQNSQSLCVHREKNGTM